MPIYCDRVPDAQRVDTAARLFGLAFSIRLEPVVFTMAERLSPDYHGGYWHFYRLCNGGFFMAPESIAPFRVQCENGWEGSMSADALGVTACLYAYSHSSFVDDTGWASKMGDHYHRLREYALDHPEAVAILGAID